MGHEELEQPVLHEVGVLELVDQHVREAAPVVLEDVGLLLEELDGQWRAGRRSRRRWRPAGRPGSAQASCGCPRRSVVVVDAVLERSTAESRSRAADWSASRLRLAQDALRQRDLVVVVVDGEAAGEAEPPRPRAGGSRRPAEWKVETHDAARPPRVRVARAASPSRSRISPAALLVKVTARIDQGAHAHRLHQVGDAVDDDPGLARARAGEDQQRAVAVDDRLALLGVEGFEEVGRHLGRGEWPPTYSTRRYSSSSSRHTGTPQKRGPSGQVGRTPASCRSVQGGISCCAEPGMDLAHLLHLFEAGPPDLLLRGVAEPGGPLVVQVKIVAGFLEANGEGVGEQVERERGLDARVEQRVDGGERLAQRRLVELERRGRAGDEVGHDGVRLAAGVLRGEHRPGAGRHAVALVLRSPRCGRASS